MIDLSTSSILIVGFARTGQAVARVVNPRSKALVAVDDQSTPDGIACARELGVNLIVKPDKEQLERLVLTSDFVVVSPGVSPTHQVYELCDSNKLMAEIELAYQLSAIPLVAITGTNGKTSVTSLVASMLEYSGLSVRAVGNIGDPLIGIVDEKLDVAVVEVSSFQLANTHEFRPKVGTWLNFAPDHLDWHASMEEYAGAKAKIWRNQHTDDVAVANCDDPVVWREAQGLEAQVVSFGSAGDYRVSDDQLIGPQGELLAKRSDLVRDFPHDVINALAAFATARAAGASINGCREALRSAALLPHRVEFITKVREVSFINDSKATTPSAVTAALSGFSSVVLIAGGRNKGLDLEEIRRFVDRREDLVLRAVVAIGEAADAVTSAFASGYRVEQAATMAEAVESAALLARTGDSVVLSPGCTSFDWYRSYDERGADFVRCVREFASREVDG